MKTKRNLSMFFVLIVLAFVLLMPFIISEYEKNKGEGLEAAYSTIKCKNDNTIGVINSIITAFPDSGSSLSQNTEVLRGDLAQLQQYVNDNDKENFSIYTRTKYRLDFKSSTDAIQNWRKENRKNFTQEQRNSLKESYDSLKNDFESCHILAMRNYGNKRLNNYKEDLIHLKERNSNLSSKINVDGLNSILDDARIQIIIPLESAVYPTNSKYNNSTKDLQDAFKKYCLYDGCKNGINFHLSAKYEIERLTQVISYLKTNTTNQSYLDDLNKAQASLDNAKNVLENVGTRQYNGDENEKIWGPIKSAQKLLQDRKNKLRERKNE